MLGWLGVALTGSDTSSNVLFGNLQQISAQQLGISPLLAAASNSSGGVMGKMIDAQSIVVAGVATGQEGGEGEILRYVFFHSIVLAALVGVSGDAASLRVSVDGAGTIGEREGARRKVTRRVTSGDAFLPLAKRIRGMSSRRIVSRDQEG